MYAVVINEHKLCKGYWLVGSHDGHEEYICIDHIYDNGIICSKGKFYLFEELSGIPVTHEWLMAANIELLTDGVYYFPDFPFTFIVREDVQVLYRDQPFITFRFVHELQHFYGAHSKYALLIASPDENQIKQRQLNIDFPSLN